MKKSAKIEMNKLCAIAWEEAISEYNETYPHEWKRLRSCSADVTETENFYILRSYYTLIACIDKRTNVLYDVLRGVYGYTSTSAQHIAKFRHDYPAYTLVTYYPA